MDKKPQPTNEGRLIEVYLLEEEMISLILVTGQANPNSLRELEPVLKSTKHISVKPTYLFEGIKSPDLPRSRDGSISLHPVTGRR